MTAARPMPMGVIASLVFGCVPLGEPPRFDRVFDHSVADAKPAMPETVVLTATSVRPVDSESQITFSRGLVVDRTEVTRAEWFRVFRTAPECTTTDAVRGCGCDVDPCDDRPASQVDWYMALVYCNIRSTIQGLSACYLVQDGSTVYTLADAEQHQLPTEQNPLDCDGYRLPTAAEWTWLSGLYQAVAPPSPADACRGSTACRVGESMPNAHGLHDVLGNVWEWTATWHDEDRQTSGTDPTGPSTGSLRILRGCGFTSAAEACEGDAVAGAEPTLKAPDVGLRPVRSRP